MLLLIFPRLSERFVRERGQVEDDGGGLGLESRDVLDGKVGIVLVLLVEGEHVIYKVGVIELGHQLVELLNSTAELGLILVVLPLCEH